MNTFKVRYNIKAQIDSTEGDGVPVEIIKKNGDTVIAAEKISTQQRITVITPEFTEPILNQEIKISSKIKGGLLGAGTCSYVAKFEKDVLYPKEIIKLNCEIDNSKCSKKIDKYKIKLLKRTQVFNLK